MERTSGMSQVRAGMLSNDVGCFRRGRFPTQKTMPRVGKIPSKYQENGGKYDCDCPQGRWDCTTNCTMPASAVSPVYQENDGKCWYDCSQVSSGCTTNCTGWRLRYGVRLTLFDVMSSGAGAFFIAEQKKGWMGGYHCPSAGSNCGLNCKIKKYAFTTLLLQNRNKNDGRH